MFVFKVGCRARRFGRQELLMMVAAVVVVAVVSLVEELVLWD
jgi:hypothetical protein